MGSRAYRIQRALPGVVVEQPATGTWWVGFELPTSEQDAHARVAELVNAAGERDTMTSIRLAGPAAHTTR